MECCVLDSTGTNGQSHKNFNDHIILRLRDSTSLTDTSSKRYIITAPPSDFVLLPTDMVFVLMQFDQGTEYRPLVEGNIDLYCLDYSVIVSVYLSLICYTLTDWILF